MVVFGIMIVSFGSSTIGISSCCVTCGSSIIEGVEIITFSFLSCNRFCSLSRFSLFILTISVTNSSLLRPEKSFISFPLSLWYSLDNCLPVNVYFLLAGMLSL